MNTWFAEDYMRKFRGHMKLSLDHKAETELSEYNHCMNDMELLLHHFSLD